LFRVKNKRRKRVLVKLTERKGGQKKILVGVSGGWGKNGAGGLGYGSL